jgi:zinc protease
VIRSLPVFSAAVLALSLAAPQLFAQVPRPARAAGPKPAASPAPAADGSKPAEAKPAPTRAPKPAPRETVSYSLGLPQLTPAIVRLPAAPVEKLANGMGVVVIPNATLPVVDVALAVSVGYTSDPQGQRGLTRAVFQGLRFGGSAGRNEADVEAFLAERGLNIQTIVGPEISEWTFRCRKEILPEALALLAELLSQPAFRRGPLEALSQQMRQSIQARGQNVEETALQEAEAVRFGADSPWTRRLQYENIHALTREAVVAHYRASVIPSRAVIGLSGDIDAATARELLGRTLGGWTGPAAQARPDAPLPMPARQLIALDRPNAVSARLLMAIPLKQRAVRRAPIESAALALFAAQLDSAQDVSLHAVAAPFRSIDGPLRVIPSLGLNDSPYLRITVPLRPREAVDGAVALSKGLQSLRNAKTTAPQLEAARREVLEKIVYSATTAPARFQLLIEAATLGLPPGYLEAIEQAVLSMTPADYERLVKEQVDLDALQMVLAGDERDYRSPPETIGLPVVRASTTPPAEPPVKLSDESAAAAEAARLLAEVQQAMGGAGVLAAIRDATWDYEAKLVRASPPVIVKQRNRWLSPSSYRQEQTSSVTTAVTYYDGKVGWSNTGRGPVALTPNLARQYRNEVIRLLFRIVRASELEGYTAHYMGSGIVKIVSPEKYQVELAVDPLTKLPERLRFTELRPTDGSPVSVEEQLSGYKQIDGVLMPHLIVVKQFGREYAEFTMTGMHFNTGLTEEQMAAKP